MLVLDIAFFLFWVYDKDNKKRKDGFAFRSLNVIMFKKKHARISGLLLAASLLTLVACGDSDDNTTDLGQNTSDPVAQTEAVTLSEQQKYINALPDADYSGDTFTILAVPDDIAWGTVSYDAEAEIGEVLNDFVFARNRSVEEKYHITMDVVTDYNIASTVKQMVFAGDDDYDMISEYVKFIMRDAGNNCYYDLLDVSSLNFENPWWDKTCVDLLTMEDHLFVAFSDMNTQPTALLPCLLVNNDLVKELDLTSPYDLVFAGTWTLDQMYALSAEAAKDLNGDGKMNEDDRYGAYLGIGTINSMLNGANQPHITRDSDNTWVLNTGTLGTINAAEKIGKIMNDTQVTVYINDNPWDIFSRGNALFAEGTIGGLSFYRNAEYTVGVLPMPKYDEEQDSYVTMMSNGSMGVTLPLTAQDPERSSTIIEALGAYSYVDLRHAYYDVTLKDKLSHDETTPKMLDLIIESRTIDLGVIYEFALGNSISSVLASIKKSGAENLASLAEKNAKSFQKNYEKIVDAYAGIE